MNPTPWLAGVLALTLVMSGCGNDDELNSSSAGVATLDDGQTEPASSDDGDQADPASTAEAPDDPELAFALYDECMTDAGFDFGTTVSGSGGAGIVVDDITLDEGDPQSQSFTSPEDFDESFTAADEQCRGHLANIDLSFDLTPEQEAELEDAQLEWAECMRGLGVDVPDFDAGGGAIAIEIGPSDNDPQAGTFGGADFDFEAFEEAAAECDGAFDRLNTQLDSEDSP